jgi:hypothetical protein
MADVLSRLESERQLTAKNKTYMEAVEESMDYEAREWKRNTDDMKSECAMALQRDAVREHAVAVLRQNVVELQVRLPNLRQQSGGLTLVAGEQSACSATPPEPAACRGRRLRSLSRTKQENASRSLSRTMSEKSLSVHRDQIERELHEAARCFREADEIDPGNFLHSRLINRATSPSIVTRRSWTSSIPASLC